LSKTDPENEIAAPESDPEVIRLGTMSLVVAILITAALIAAVIYASP
jgi:hypothetical protein